MAQNEKSKRLEGSDTLFSRMPETDALFAKLAAGEHPDFLAVMAGISDMVAFYTDHDTNAQLSPSGEIFESQNNCRFCS